jgi:hypothetical protein
MSISAIGTSVSPQIQKSGGEAGEVKGRPDHDGDRDDTAVAAPRAGRTGAPSGSTFAAYA